jgi:hypothetical protein
MHILPILAGAVAYWLLGALWYSLMFGSIWGAVLEARGIIVANPTRPQLYAKFILGFLANLATAGAIACVFGIASPDDPYAFLRVGPLIGLATAMGIGVSYIWESRSLVNYLIDAGYHFLGITLATFIIAHWW